jgi:hypothetical protein
MIGSTPRKVVLGPLLAVLAVLGSMVAAVPPAQAAPLPLDKQNWVVSVAGFRTDAYRNYIRLGYLVFSPTGNTVEHNFWTWNQADRPLPVNSGDVHYCGDYAPGTNPRNNCPIRTAPGFTGDPNGRMTGVYRYDATSADAGTATITWTRSTLDGTTSTVDLQETWQVSSARTGLGKMTLASSGYSLTHGIAYGSNAPLDAASKAPMSEIRTRTETFWLEGASWNNNQIKIHPRGLDSGLTMNSWVPCDDGSCLGYVQYNAGCAESSCCQPDDQACKDRLKASGNRRFYYMTGQFGGRRNTYEYWCECLSYEQCYAYNSHVKPLLQVVDDAGRFQGWVGAEVSPDRRPPPELKGEFYAVYALVA